MTAAKSSRKRAGNSSSGASFADARSARRVANAVAILAEAFAAWNILAWYLVHFAAGYTRPDLAAVAASARRREWLAGVLVVAFLGFAVYALSRSPRRAQLPARSRYLRSALLAAAGVIVLLALEALVLALMLRNVHLQ